MLKDLDLPSNEALMVLSLVYYATDLPSGEVDLPPSTKDLRAVGEAVQLKRGDVDRGLSECLERKWLQCPTPESPPDELRYILTQRARMTRVVIQQALLCFGPESALDDLPKWCLAGRDERIMEQFRKRLKL